VYVWFGILNQIRRQKSIISTKYLQLVADSTPEQNDRAPGLVLVKTTVTRVVYICMLTHEGRPVSPMWRPRSRRNGQGHSCCRGRGSIHIHICLRGWRRPKDTKEDPKDGQMHEHINRTYTIRVWDCSLSTRRLPY
jgi:hypothetical protein